jgi:sugar lactone lactonase YvrE
MEGAQFSAHVFTAAIEGLAAPEAVVYDAAADVYLISNLGDPFSDALDGFVLRYDPDSGTTTRFIDGLISPSGMTILGEVLYVVDRDGLRRFDRATGAPLGTVSLPVVGISDGFIFYNDVCGGADGRLFVTGTNLNADLEVLDQSAIFMVEDGEAEVFAQDLPLGPNGCIRQGSKNVIFTSFGEGGIYRINASGKLQEVYASEMLPGGTTVRCGSATCGTSPVGRGRQSTACPPTAST